MSLILAKVSGLTRSPGDPKVIESGPSSITSADRFGHALGWFSMGLGLTELFAPKVLTRWLGMEGQEGLVRAYGVREMASGVLCLSVNKDYGAASRVVGDVLDLATLGAAYNDDNPKKGNVGIAIAAVAGIAIIDALTAKTVRSIHDRKGEPIRDYSDRSGFPKGVGYSRGKASGRVPQDYRATPAAAAASPATGVTSPASADLELEVSG